MTPFTINAASVSAAAAQTLTEAASRAAHARGLAVTVAVVDHSGLLKAFARMDGASLLSVDIAIDKAWTAAANGMPTHAWRDLLDDDPAVAQIAHRPRLTAFAGGYPLTIDGRLVGGLGVSGAHHSEDRDIAQAALQALGLPA
ncbi:MAG: GlcG/HbpS family heme-binding protein [Motilibacteraceae bacterium]